MNARRFPLARAFPPGTHSGLLRTGLRYTRIEFHLDGHQTYPLDTPRLPAVCPTWRRRRGLPSCCGTFRPLGVADGSLSWSSGVETTAILFNMSSGRDCGDYGRAPRVPFSGEANLERVSPRWFQEFQRRNVAQARKKESGDEQVGTGASWSEFNGCWASPKEKKPVQQRGKEYACLFLKELLM